MTILFFVSFSTYTTKTKLPQTYTELHRHHNPT